MTTIDDDAPAPENTAKGWRIGLVEDEEQYRESLRLQLASVPEATDFRAWSSAEEYWRDPARGEVDLLFVDIRLKHMDGIELVQMLSQADANLRIIMLTGLASEELIFRALKAGAIGYVLKSEIPEIGSVIRLMMNGGAIISPTIALRIITAFQAKVEGADESANLTPREKQVLEQMAAGLSIKLASQRLGVSENTVNTHLKSIYKKLNVRNRVEMMNRAMKMGLI